MLQAKDLVIGYTKDRPLISGINFQCAPAELIILLGINGIGKSTLLKTICGLLEPSGGSIAYNDIDLYKTTTAERARLISGVFTGKEFDPYISVYEFVALGRYPYTDWLGTLGPADKHYIKQAIQAMGLEHLADKKVLRISDGERQKTMIAKALAQDTPVIIMDEPTAFLDYKNKAELLKTIKKLAWEGRKTIIISTHDISAALPYSDRAFLITESGHFSEMAASLHTEDELKAVMETH